MKHFFWTILLTLLALGSHAQTVPTQPGSALVVSRLEDFIEVTKQVVEETASNKSHVETRPELNRLLIIAAFDFVQITRNAPSREAYLKSLDRNIECIEPMVAQPDERKQVAEFFDELLELVGVDSSDGRLDAFIARRSAAQALK